MIVTLAALALAAAPPAPPAPPAPAPPTPAAPAAPADAAALAATQRLLDLIRVERQYDQLLAQMIPVLSTQIFASLKDNARAPAKVRAYLADADGEARAARLFAAEAARAFRRRYPAMRAAVAAEYARAFTLAELDAVAAFYGSPVGAKALRVLPELQAKLMPVGADAGREAGMEAMRHVIEQLSLDAPAAQS